MGYVRSKYTRCVPVNGNCSFVHNLASGSECLMDREETERFLGDSNFNRDDPEAREWYELGFLVDEGVDEDACLELERRITAYASIRDKFGLVIAPTMDCNARCFYCYENETRAKCYMNRETEDQLVRYIKKMAEGKKLVHISWFGGEPVLCIDLMRRVSDEIIRFCDERSIRYEAELTTNGYYLDGCFEEFGSLRITDTQITLDGFEKEHEVRKNYVRGTDAWKRTIDNIFRCSNAGHHITLRMNVDRSNLDGIRRAAEYLLQNPRWNRNISIYFYPLEPVGCNAGVYFEEEEYAGVLEELYLLLYNNGYYKDRESALAFQRLSLPCYGGTLAETAVDYRGNLYQCQHLLCRPGQEIGNIYDGIRITRKVLEWYDGTLPEGCRGCAVVPLCQGGCVTKRHLGQERYLCHMMKYRLDVQEKMKVMLLKEQYHL